ncbi:YggT family protein [Marinobacterium weihaiense]|uniref:YggT family protein n=1 Tax=Marinobacterium weihaiense TaxID=2851016 RepID=A0ABS6MAH1_9GAMM|nr:YggT family protein [Marinobacterium weihaiense]MBV0933286.1 YggT family protein [Marinobacterium weihaiense]
MGQDPITLIVSLVGGISSFLLLMRFALQLSQADYYNPISQSVVRITQPVVGPLQKALRPRGRFDFATLIVAIAVKAISILLLIQFAPAFASLGGSINPLHLLVFSLTGVLNTLLTIYFWASLGAVIISWVAPSSYHPAPQLLLQLTEPLFGLARKVIPPIGGLDLSPILIFLLIQIVQGYLRGFVIL